MKRLLFTLVAWGAVLLPMAAHAQRGMGFHGSSAPAARGGAGFAARPAGFAARPGGFVGRPMPAGRLAPAGIRSMPGGRIMTTPQGRRVVITGQRSSVSRSRFFFNHRFHHRFHNGFFFNDFSCFNGFNSFGCGNPFLFGDPFLFGGIGYPGDPFYYNNGSYPYQPQQQPVVEEQDNGSRELALQVQELSDEIQAMREQQRSQGEPRKAEPAPQSAKDNSPNAILVFRDGLQLPVRNYAIAGGTIFVLDQPNQKIALSKLDIPATQQVNDKNGLEIHLPKSN